MLQVTRAPATLVDALLILCQIARLGERLGGRSTAAGMTGGGLGAALHASVLGERLPPLLSHVDAGVRAKSCNLLGNLCKHSSDFYEDLLLQGGLLPLLAHRCADPDAQTRKFASFAVGNAGFHSARLYAHLTPTVAPLVNIGQLPDRPRPEDARQRCRRPRQSRTQWRTAVRGAGCARGAGGAPETGHSCDFRRRPRRRLDAAGGSNGS